MKADWNSGLPGAPLRPGGRAVGQCLRASEVCELLRISPGTLWRLRRSGKLPAVRVGGQVRYRERDLEAFLNENSEKAGR